jgi:hypothetical protein
MAARVFARDVLEPRIGLRECAARIMFVALLVAAPLLPEMTSSLFIFPAVANWWVSLPFCGLFLLALADVRHLRRLYNLDLLVLGSFVVGLGCSSRTSGIFPMLALYVPLVYLAVRMLMVARVGRTGSARPTEGLHQGLPWQWLLVGIVVLCAVHLHWALDDPSTSDVGEASVQGALKIVHGHALYGAEHSESVGAVDEHFDTYGPFNYEAYVPFVIVAHSALAARLATLFFTLLSALLLFVLGRRVRGPTAGAALAFAWLAYPITLFADGFDFNDALVAATLIGTLLVAASPVRRGAMAALAGWTKLSPLALVPVMVAYGGRAGESRRRAVLGFCASFILVSTVIFVPALDHSSLSTFVTRTFGFQAKRPPMLSIWSLLGNSYHHAAWIVDACRATHGLLTALVVGLVLVLPRLPRRQDLIGLASASAAVLIALQVIDGYYSYSYLLWFVPLVLVALALEHARSATAVGRGIVTDPSRAILGVSRHPALAGASERD